MGYKYFKLLNQQPVNDCPSISPFTSGILQPETPANANRMSKDVPSETIV